LRVDYERNSTTHVPDYIQKPVGITDAGAITRRFNT
jgi:hypothetical protein